ncbi:MAG TPA: hypothetical protein PKW98_08770 [Candidatus Wallbacteria bacterium]|nr:hypothetical protein [Candidatus Wallbacteria bacterium]HPG57899.1 hypothetical protein [Candidatus Wallbacteria bacterium]
MFYMREKFAEAFLLGFLICCVGFTGLYAFMGHFFFADRVAQGIGWPAGNPFQKEVAFTNLGIGILGFLCIWIRGNFWAAAVIMNSTFLLGAAYIHYMEIIQKANLNPLNAGTVFYFDILIPVITLGLLIASRLTKSENK